MTCSYHLEDAFRMVRDAVRFDPSREPNYTYDFTASTTDEKATSTDELVDNEGKPVMIASCSEGPVTVMLLRRGCTARKDARGDAQDPTNGRTLISYSELDHRAGRFWLTLRNGTMAEPIDSFPYQERLPCPRRRIVLASPEVWLPSASCCCELWLREWRYRSTKICWPGQ